LKLIESITTGKNRQRHASSTFPRTKSLQKVVDEDVTNDKPQEISEKRQCVSCKRDLSVDLKGGSTTDAYKRRLRRLRDVYAAIDDAQVFLDSNGISDKRFFCQYRRVSRARRKLEASLEAMSSRSLPLGGLGRNNKGDDDGVCTECEFASFATKTPVDKSKGRGDGKDDDGEVNSNKDQPGSRCQFVTFGKVPEVEANSKTSELTIQYIFLLPHHIFYLTLFFFLNLSKNN
jgi:hypothetical protein